MICKKLEHLKVDIGANRRIKKTILIFLGIIVVFLISPVIFTIKTGYNIKFGNRNEYDFLLNEKYRINKDTLAVTEYRKSDCYTHFKIKNFYFGIQEIYALERIKLSSIKFNENLNLNNINFYPAQIINEKIMIVPSVRSYWNITFDSILNVNFNGSTHIDSIKLSNNYICYHAHIDKMLFSNENNDEMMYFDFNGKSKNTLLLFLMKGNRFFIITVNSNKDFGIEVLEDIFDI